MANTMSACAHSKHAGGNGGSSFAIIIRPAADAVPARQHATINRSFIALIIALISALFSLRFIRYCSAAEIYAFMTGLSLEKEMPELAP